MHAPISLRPGWLHGLGLQCPPTLLHSDAIMVSRAARVTRSLLLRLLLANCAPHALGHASSFVGLVASAPRSGHARQLPSPPCVCLLGGLIGGHPWGRGELPLDFGAPHPSALPSACPRGSCRRSSRRSSRTKDCSPSAAGATPGPGTSCPQTRSAPCDTAPRERPCCRSPRLLCRRRPGFSPLTPVVFCRCSVHPACRSITGPDVSTKVFPCWPAPTSTPSPRPCLRWAACLGHALWDVVVLMHRQCLLPHRQAGPPGCQAVIAQRPWSQLRTLRVAGQASTSASVLLRSLCAVV